MQPREAGQARDPLVDLGVVLHRAGPERIHAQVDREVLLRESNEVPEHLRLAHLGKRRLFLATLLAIERLQIDLGEIVTDRERRGRSAGRPLLEEQGDGEIQTVRYRTSQG